MKKCQNFGPRQLVTFHATVFKGKYEIALDINFSQYFVGKGSQILDKLWSKLGIIEPQSNS